MYNQKMVASIKANGRILRENKDTVYIPFGSEYSFLIKNLHTQRAVVNVFIDGENVVEGGLVVDPGREIDLERYVKQGNLKAGNKFKFIERTSAIEDHRGVKLEDGLIRIEFQYEAVKPVSIYTARDFFKSSEFQGVADKFTVVASGSTSQTNVNGLLRGVDFSANGMATTTAASQSINNYCAQNNISASVGSLHDGMATMDSMPANDVGITVPGSKSTQSFQTVTMGIMETEKHAIVLKLLGETPDNKPVVKPVTVKAKSKCVTCGKMNKAHAKFCVECGTALEIFA
jgi:hypothetical protein